MNLFTLSKCRLVLAFIFLAVSYQSFAVTKTSTGTGSWNTVGTWSPAGVPAAGDDVIIAAGHTVTLNANSASLLSLTVNGTLTIGNNTTNRTLTVAGIITVNSGGALTTAGNGGNALLIGGNLVNNGTFDMNIGTADCDVTFNGAANQSISGSGSTTDFNDIIINNTGAANNNIVEVMPAAFSAAAAFLTLTRGIIKMSGTYTLINTFFTPVTHPVTNYLTITINADEGLWLNNPNITVTGQGCDIELSGLLRISSGIYNAGTTGTDWWVYYHNGAVMTIEGGILNTGGSFDANTVSDAINYTQSGGIFNVNTLGNSGAFGMVSSFGIPSASSTFTMSGGSVVIQQERGTVNTANDFNNLAGTSTVTGGTIQIGNASTTAPATNFRVNSTVAVYNLLINSTNNPVAEITTNTTVLNDVTISAGGTLDVTTSNYGLFVGRNFVNNGTFTARSGTVTFNGTGLQTISGTTATSFYGLTANNTAGNTTTGITLGSPATVTNTLMLTNGHITTSNTNLLTMNAGSNVAGSSYGAPGPKTTSGGGSNSFINGPMRKIGNTAFLFPVGKISTGTATTYGHHPCGISAPSVATDAFTAEYMRGSAAYMGSVSAAGLDHVSNCEYWDIARTGNSTVNVSLSWSGASDCNSAVYVNDIPTIKAVHFNGSTWDDYGGLIDAPSTVTEGSVTWAGVSAFSLFSIGSTSAMTNPLPVKLANVKAYRSGNSNKVDWSNLTEMEVVKYEVERSTGGNNFNWMTTIAPRSNSTGREDYNVLDLQPPSLAFYRIKVTSLNGEVLYSPVVKVAGSNAAAELNLYPNPVTGRQLTLYINNSKAGVYNLRIYAANGQVVKTETFRHPGGSYSKTIELPEQLQAGQYFIQAIDKDGQVSVMKFVAQ